MVSTFTANIQLEEPARGDQVGTWDTPVNANMTLIDKVVGANSTIALNNSPVVLAAAQYQSKMITFSSTLTGSVAITFPTSFMKSYEIQNLCTGSSAFVITLQTTAAGGQVICCPPGEIIDCINDGVNIKFKNLGRVGGYLDFGGSSVPAWVSGCTVKPYLNCDGTAFSSATYPALTVFLGGTTLPDRRGTTGYTLNQGTGRLTAASGGVDANTNYTVKTTPTVTIGTSNLPAYTPAGAVGSVLGGTMLVGNSAGGAINSLTRGDSLGSNAITTFLNAATVTSVFTGTAQGGVSNALPAIGTATVYGLCLIRSA